MRDIDIFPKTRKTNCCKHMQKKQFFFPDHGPIKKITVMSHAINLVNKIKSKKQPRMSQGAMIHSGRKTKSHLFQHGISTSFYY